MEGTLGTKDLLIIVLVIVVAVMVLMPRRPAYMAVGPYIDRYAGGRYNKRYGSHHRFQRHRLVVV